VRPAVRPGHWRTLSASPCGGFGEAHGADDCGGAGTLEQLCDSLTSGLLPADSLRTDDAALLAVRVHAAAPDAVAAWSLPEDPLAAWEARRHVREQLGIWHLDELAADTEILASELVTNVVRHARGPIQLRLLRSQTLICEVFDGSATTPRIRRASWNDEGGRGLQLVTALCDRWGTRYMAEGKCIWTEQSLPLSQLSRPKLPVAGRAARSSSKGNGTDLRGSLPAVLGKMWRDQLLMMAVSPIALPRAERQAEGHGLHEDGQR
jgi:hypothetical protein